MCGLRMYCTYELENNPKKKMNGTIAQKFDNHEDHSTEDNKDEQ